MSAKVAVGVTFATNGLAFAGGSPAPPRSGTPSASARPGSACSCSASRSPAIATIPLAGPARAARRAGPVRAARRCHVVLGLVGLGTGTALGSVPLAGVGPGAARHGQQHLGRGHERRGRRRRAPARPHRDAPLPRRLQPRHRGRRRPRRGAAATGMPVSTQLFLTAALAAVVMVVTVRRFTPHPPARRREAPMSVRQAWREPRTLLIGLIMLGFGFTEGTANDWLAISLVDGYDATETVGAIGFGVFVAAMTLARLFGGYAIERWGRVAVLRGTAASAARSACCWWSPASACRWRWLGALLWGAGASLGFPIGMSSAADDPVRAAIRVSVAGSIGYGAFLAGPPLIGLLAEHLGVLRAILCVLVALAIGLAASGAARPLPEAAERGASRPSPPASGASRPLPEAAATRR